MAVQKSLAEKASVPSLEGRKNYKKVWTHNFIQYSKKQHSGDREFGCNNNPSDVLKVITLDK